jgi:transposase
VNSRLFDVTSEELFAMGLGLSDPWIVTASSIENGELHIKVDFNRGSRFDGRAVHDSVERSWRHLNFWQYPTYIHARVPRVMGPDGKVSQVEVPWARPGSGFTALFEALAITMCRHMPVSRVGKELEMDDMSLWRLLERAVKDARQSSDFSTVKRVGVDETACRRGHNYITQFVDLDRTRVLFVCQGKGAETLKLFKADLVLHGGKAENIRTFSSDMSPAFLSGISEHFPKAEVVLDKFHLVKMLSEAVDETRRSESAQQRQGKGMRFLWLKNPNKLKAEQRQLLDELRVSPAFAQTAEAYRLRLAFQELFLQPKNNADHYLATWLDAAYDCGVRAIEDVAETFFKMRDKILSWFDNRVSNGILEGLNSVLQSAKNRARGYANPNHMILMSYLLHGKLNLTPDHLRTMKWRKRTSTGATHTT